MSAGSEPATKPAATPAVGPAKPEVTPTAKPPMPPTAKPPMPPTAKPPMPPTAKPPEEHRRAPAGAAVLRADITEAIRDALRQELAAAGYGRLSIEAVARRAGVGKTAIYRRWGSKLELVLDLVTELAGQRLPLPDTGSLRGDLEVVLGMLARALRHPLASQIIPDLLAEAARNRQMAQTLHEAMRVNQRAVTATLLARAVTRGELAPGSDPDAVVDLIVGPLYWRLAVIRDPLPAGHLPRLATAIAAALRAGQPPGWRPELP